MKIITVSTAKAYDVYIGSDILPRAASILRNVTQAKTICIVSDTNVFSFYGHTLSENLKSSGFRVCSFLFTPGESSKNPTVYFDLLNTLAQSSLTRSDCIIALGGGVTGDLAGFAAATYLRGIDYVQIPTSLLAMVDSSVGGKTGINLPAGKNLAGAFWQPIAVLCDTDTLQTLPEDNFREGSAEVIKYGILFDPDLFSHLEKTGMDFDRETVIARCVELKRDVVTEDERESGKRKLLNLGHTLGHAIEKLSNYTISHGRAVAAGMAMICRGCHFPQTQRILRLLDRFGLPTTTVYSAGDLFSVALSDKKRSGNTLDLIIPERIGHCVIRPTPLEQLKSLIEGDN